MKTWTDRLEGIVAFIESGNRYAKAKAKKELEKMATLADKCKEKIMKLYYFNPNGYGAEYFVMAKNKDKAYKSLLDYFKNEIISTTFAELYKEELISWEKSMPTGYSLDEYNEGIVIESEIA